MPEIVFQAADVSFAEAYSRVHADCFDKAWNEPAMRQILLMPGAFGFLASQEGHPAGFIICSSAADEAEIVSVGVVPGLRRQGVGEKLLTLAIEFAKQNNKVSFFLEVAVDNLPAIALYKQSGFKNVGLRKKYYDRGDDKIDALVMRADL